MEFALETMETTECYRLLTRLVAPRPIAFVSSLDAAGRGNLAPFSFFMLGGAAPPSVVICPLGDRRRGDKDTLRNIESTGEYVIHVVTEAMVARVNQASFDYPPEVDEFDAAGFTRVPSVRVRPPRVAESPVAMECRRFQVVRHGSGPMASNYIIGEVVHVHVDDAVLTDGLPDTHLIQPAARLGANDWSITRAAMHFSLARPTAP
ncbi:MAG: flavin reductase family protein [Gemmatimonadaceae bacterium]|nr:flavin reductase family protein [Gemmatimonadaceae bacterium]